MHGSDLCGALRLWTCGRPSGTKYSIRPWIYGELELTFCVAVGVFGLRLSFND
jgi:hypothetical protein